MPPSSASVSRLLAFMGWGHGARTNLHHERPHEAHDVGRQRQQQPRHAEPHAPAPLHAELTLPPPPLPSSNSSDELGFPEVEKPRKLSLGGGSVVGTGAAVGSTARRATIASNFDRMSNDIATKFAGVKVNVQHPTKKYKTYMPYMGSLAAAVGMKKDGSATSTSTGGKKK